MSEQIQAYLERLVAHGKAPGVQYACVGVGGEIESYVAGWADLQTQLPMTSRSRLMAYSMSKVLTSVAVSRLAEQRDLSLEDPISNYLPEQPYGDSVTVRHLLEHRSGIPNPIPLRWVHLAEEHATFDEHGALVAVLRHYPKLKFAPGTRQLYSNIGYWLLGHIVERVSQVPFTSFVEDGILRSLRITPNEISYGALSGGQDASGYLEKYSFMNALRPMLTNRRIAGKYEGSWLRIRNHFVNGPAFGGAFGSATGFCKFTSQLLDRDIFGLSKHGDATYKEGGGAGFHCILRLDRSRKRVSVLMSNATVLNVSACLGQLDSLHA